MIPVQFDYATPQSLEAAVNLLKENEKAQILAGGHSLIVEMKLGRTSPSLLVDLRKIEGLRGIKRRETDGVFEIGAMTTYAEIAVAPEIGEYHALIEAANSIGDAQSRNWSTIGDVFAYRELACDLPAVALALEATFNTINPSGTRAVPADEFIAAINTKLEPGEIVTSIDFPRYVTGTGSAYESFKHPASGYTICGIAALVEQSSDGTVGKCRVAFTGATTHAVRLLEVEAALSGTTAENVAAAAQRAKESVATKEASEGLTIHSDRYASAEYRVHLMGVLAERALARAIKRASPA